MPVTAQHVNDFLTERLAPEEYELPPDERARIKHDLAGYIADKIVRKRFRRRVGDETRVGIRDKVAMSVSNDAPIYFTLPFGGYKHFWNPSHPAPDWAEVFHFVHMTDYVAPILSAYEPGVILEYISQDMILTRMNNYPVEALDAYSRGFTRIMDWHKRRAPTNLDVRYFRVGDRCDREAILLGVEAMLPERRRIFDALSAELTEQELNRSRRSLFWEGAEDLSDLSEAGRRDRIIESRLVELAYYDTEAAPEHLGDYYFEGERIDIWFSGGLSPDNAFGGLTLSTAPGSVVDAGIGRGVVVRDGRGLRGTIVSRTQFEGSSGVEHVAIDAPSVGAPQGVAYSMIDVVSGP
jgi:hypothetical protein